MAARLSVALMVLCGCARTGLELETVTDGGANNAGAGASPSAAGTATGGAPSPAMAGAAGKPAVGGMAGSSGSSGAGTVCGPLIDDMENGTGHICMGEGRQGVWYAFNDGSGTQWPAPTTPGTPIAMSPSSRPGSRVAVHTYGHGFLTWGAGIGIDLAYDGNTYRTYDAMRYDGIRFWARSDLANALDVRISTPTSTEAQYGGSCPAEPCPGPQRAGIQTSSEWVQYTVSFNQLEAGMWVYHPVLERRAFLNIQFTPPAGAGPFDFWIDDITFYTAARDCCASLPPACRGELHFQDPNLAAAVRDSMSVTDRVSCEDTCTHPLLGASGRKIQSLAGVECLTLLTGADLSKNSISDMAPLASLSSLIALSLDNNPIRVLPTLTAMTRLQSIGFDNDPLTDFGPLLGAPSLVAVAVVGAAVDCAEQAQNLTVLRSRGIVFSDCP